MNQITTPNNLASKSLWTLWRTYLWRWLLLGLIGGGLQPVLDNLDNFWQQKLYQMLSGIPFGLACFVVFTPLQNWINTPRVRWKSWLTVIGTWMGMKFIFLGIFVAMGIA